MKWRLVLGLASLSAAPAGAEALARLQVQPERSNHPRTLNLRLEQEQPFAIAPLHHSLISMETGVAPRTSLGLDLIRTVAKRPGSADFRLDGKVKRSRAAAVSLRLKF